MATASKTGSNQEVRAVRAGAGSDMRGLLSIPDCGASVFWYTEFLPHDVGIAFGAFADPLPWPTVSVWEMTRHPWVNFDHPVDRFTDQLSTPATPATG